MSTPTPSTRCGCGSRPSTARQPGDPARAAVILCDVAGRDELPLRLPLGLFAVETTARVAREAASTVEEWGETPLQADYPE